MIALLVRILVMLILAVVRLAAILAPLTVRLIAVLVPILWRALRRLRGPRRQPAWNRWPSAAPTPLTSRASFTPRPLWPRPRRRR